MFARLSLRAAPKLQRLTIFRALGSPSSSAPPSALASPPKEETPTPSIKDLVIQLTFIDPSGARRKVSGLVGKTLYEVCEMQGIDLGPSSLGSSPEVARSATWIEPTFGEGSTSGFDHVVLVGKGADNANRRNHVEEQILNDYWDFDEIYEGSRLASAVILTKEMDGMTVYVPDRLADDVP